MKLTFKELQFIYEEAVYTDLRLRKWGTEDKEDGTSEFKVENLSEEDQRKFYAVNSIIKKLEGFEF